MNGEKNEGLEEGREKKPDSEPDISAEERLERAFKAGAEKKRKEVGVIIARLEALAQQAQRRKNITPSFSFQAKLQTAEEIKRFKEEYESLKNDVMRQTASIARSQETGKEFEQLVNSHLRVLDDCFDLENDFGFKPLK